MFTIKRDDDSKYLIFATKAGLVKRCNISEFENIRSSGKIAISLKDDDELISVSKSDGNKYIALVSSNGRMVKFIENEVRIWVEVHLVLKVLNLKMRIVLMLV